MKENELRVSKLTSPCLAVAALAGAPIATAATASHHRHPQASGASGGASMAVPAPGASTPAHPVVQGFAAKIIHGVAYAPSYAPIRRSSRRSGPATRSVTWRRSGSAGHLPVGCDERSHVLQM